MAGIGADHLDATSTPDDLALVAHWLDTWTDLHGLFFFQTNGWYGLLVAIGDATTGEVIGGDLYLNFVARQNADAVHPHLPRAVREDLMTVFELDAEHRVRQRLGDGALEHDRIFLWFGQKKLLD